MYWGAHHGASTRLDIEGTLCFIAGLRRLDDSKIEKFYTLAARYVGVRNDHDVGRLQVTMDQTLLMYDGAHLGDSPARD